MVFKKVEPTMDFVSIEEKILKFWQDENIFKKSVENRKGSKQFVFYEGPPTANGKPHAGHVLTRVVKDLIPRYKTMTGYYVERKGGWDTHGLPVELEVEKQLGISGKPDIEKYGVEDFIKKCKESVFTYEQEWRKMSERVGFWIDMEDPYITYKNYYIESVWWALRQIWDKGLLYKGHKVVPYCPRCGTSLSSHEVAQGYKEVEEPSIFVKFPLEGEENTYLLVWTTTPWTLPSNVAAAVGPDYDYCKVENNGEFLIMAKELLNEVLEGDYKIVETFKGINLKGKRYRPVFPFGNFGGDAYYIILGDFVTLKEGTGIVHIAPAFGEDDARVGREYGLPTFQPVDPQGRFTEEVAPWKGVFVKEADEGIIKDLKERGLLYKVLNYTHTYPFCWRCDTPLLYYARGSWFIKTTAIKDKLLENNQKINWYPEHIKDGRFGNFLENVIDWCLSRERYWGTPLNIWECQECDYQHCVGSIAELKEMSKTEIGEIELHKPYVDEVELECPKCGGTMKRVPEVIDCWFDSGSMPFAQFHYPFNNRDKFEGSFPADFISEAIDQTRGWFYSLHVISSLVFEQPSFKNCLVMGHVLDEFGQKMSKHKGNVLDPWEVLNEQGADAMRWYLFVASPPWIPSRFYKEAVREAQRKFLNTLYNVYSFFTLYANIDGFDPREYEMPVEKRAEIDRWLISRLNNVIKGIRKSLDSYNITPAARMLDDFVDDLSNWYVRRCRQRYWKGEMDDDKIAAYLTLYETLVALIKIAAPFVPFITEEIYKNLVCSIYPDAPESVHMCNFPEANEELIDEALEQKMALLRKVVNLGRSARNKSKIKNRQPLSKMYIKTRRENEKEALKDDGMSSLIKEELNIKEIDFTDEVSKYLSYTIKPRYDMLGPKYGKLMPQIAKTLATADSVKLMEELETNGVINLELDGETVAIEKSELDIKVQDREGFSAEGDNGYYVILDTTITKELELEGISREIVSKIQNMRKEAGFNVEDKIVLYYYGDETIDKTFEKFGDVIKAETLSLEARKEKPEEADNIKNWNINGHTVLLAVKR
ncbi:MAG: isoleucyl-tRNA synthetase [Thermosediminibacterales bacterium]|nr:isoleucyl-tRNA synthetase [Thermosediminibacterales bacterium]MDK2836421.1 isoleucyl-tRNA synthetase [Thermosediminibacterales bacterium]